MSHSNPDAAVAQTACAVMMVSFPHQLLHALCALEHDRVINAIPTDTPAVLVLWSYEASDHEPDSRTRQFFATALHQYPFISTLIFSRQERDGPLSPYRNLMKRARWLEQRLSEIGGCSTFYYAHDASSDHTSQAFMQALRPGRIICYGDAPGFLYPSYPPERPRAPLSLRGFKELFWRSRLRNVKTWLTAEKALIAINFDDQVEGIPYPEPVVIPADAVMHTLHSLKKTFPEIDEFEQHVIQAGYSTTALLILSNFTRSKFTSQKNELALYIDICKEHVTTRELLYIKKHAGTDSAFVTQLLDALGEYRVQPFPEHLEHLPIELFTVLNQQCKVISVSSASALLALSSDSSVIHALTRQHIGSLFVPAQRQYMNSANDRIMRNSTRLNKPALRQDQNQ